MTIQEATEKLANEYSHNPNVSSVGSNNSDVLFMYVKDSFFINEKDKFADGYFGFEVRVVNVGKGFIPAVSSGLV